MRTSRTSVALGAVAAVLAAAAIPAIGQKAPESILPPGFNDPVGAPTPSASATAGPRPVTEGVGTASVGGSAATTEPGGTLPTPTPSATPAPIDPATLAAYEMPAYARRSLTQVGAAGPSDGAFAPHAFGRTDGRYLETLMRRLDAPIASRWLSIALRRALVARINTPRGVNGADFAAERGWLLLRMGEAVSARAVVQSVDNDDYTPKLYQIAMQAALATGDPGALCPLVEPAIAATGERGWIAARAMCAGLSGEPGKVKPLIAAAHRQAGIGGIDLLLTQKVAGAGASGRQAVTIEWASVDRLTAWRFGLAVAGGEDIPETLYATVSPAVQAWRALSPSLEAGSRAAAAEQAAVRGIFSNVALVDLYSSIGSDDDQAGAAAATANDLRAAYTGADRKARIEAMKSLWEAPKQLDARYARRILTARAAARLAVSADDLQPEDVDGLVASMLSAGLDQPATRWRGIAAKGSDASAMLALASPAIGLLPYSDVSAYSGSNDPLGLKRRMFFAGLAGLGRLSRDDIETGAKSLDIKIGGENAWTRAIAKAARDREPGTVTLLAAIGMQTRLWQGVPPVTLYHIVAALRSVGLEGEARMVAAEAIARL